MTFRCRASFSVALLNEELPLEMVAQILGKSWPHGFHGNAYAHETVFSR
jgi:hypothetical protein